MSILAQMTSCAMHYDVIYRPLAMQFSIIENVGVDSPASSVHKIAWLASIAFEFSGVNR